MRVEETQFEGDADYKGQDYGNRAPYPGPISKFSRESIPGIASIEQPDSKHRTKVKECRVFDPNYR